MMGAMWVWFSNLVYKKYVRQINEHVLEAKLRIYSCCTPSVTIL